MNAPWLRKASASSVVTQDPRLSRQQALLGEMVSELMAADPKTGSVLSTMFGPVMRNLSPEQMDAVRDKVYELAAKFRIIDDEFAL